MTRDTAARSPLTRLRRGLLPPGTAGTLRYEALLALRRRAWWLSLVPMCLLALWIGLGSPTVNHFRDPAERTAAASLLVATLGALGVAMSLADRVASQRLPGWSDLVEATPAGRAGRALGVVLGPWLVAVTPVVAVLLVLGTRIALVEDAAAPLLVALLAVPVVVVPATLWLTMVANLLALLLPAAAARALLVPGWYWATALSPLVPVPSVTGTVLSPVGAYPAAAWLSGSPPPAGEGWLHPPVGPASALAAVAVTLLAAAVAFLLAQAVVAVRR